MRVTRIAERISLIDVETGGFENFVASYVLEGKQMAIVETGPTSSVPNILRALDRIQVRPEDVAYVAVTHIHLDHGGGVGTLIKNLPNAQVIVHPVGAPHLVNPQKLWQQSVEVQGDDIVDLYLAPEPVAVERIVKVADGMTFDLGDGVKLRVVETLGHASHHQSYHETSSRGLFSGDAAGIFLKEFDVVVPTIPAPFRLESALASLDRLIALNPKFICYSHFGKATNAVERLQKYCEQLRLWTSIAETGLNSKWDFEKIRREITEKDPCLRKALDFVKDHVILSTTVLKNSVEGAIKYVERSRRV